MLPAFRRREPETVREIVAGLEYYLGYFRLRELEQKKDGD
jgi:hypothetical protein